MFSRKPQKNNYHSTVRARIKARIRNKGVWCIGALFACCLLGAIASPWTVTGSNPVNNRKQGQSARPQVKAPSSETQNSVSLLGSYFGNQDSTKTWLAAGMNAPAAQRPQSSDGIWQTIDSSSIAAADWQAPPADSYQVLRLNKDALAQQLARAPMERTGDLRESPAVLSLPMPDGSFERFHIEESPVMDAELVARYPEIKSYRGQGIEDGAATVRFDWTPLGFHALVLSADHAVNILPPNQSDVTTYASYYDQGEAFECGVTSQHQISKPTAKGGIKPEVAVGTTLRTYRIAVAATNEFCVLVGGNTVAGSTAAINAYLNGINAIWERELSEHMNLVSAPNVVYAGDNVGCGGACTGANDPYTNGNTTAMLNEVRPDLDTKVGQANYDIGHVLGTNSGGIAFVGVVCQNAMCNAQPGACKGGGASGMSAPAGNSGSVGLWAHELGHQHGGNHTHNAITGSCGPGNGPNDNRDGVTAVEPGSGTTILSYVGICGAGDNISNTRDLRWHAGTFADISAFLAGAQAMGCLAANPATGNNIPTVNAGAPFTIPRNTPFTLTATGTDPDPADIPNLTFIWEQVDAAGGNDCTVVGNLCNPPYGDQPADVGNTRPLFRSFSPIKGKTRTFPSLTYILNNANVPPATVGGFRTAEDLPSRSRTMNFRATVRDNRAGGGGVDDSSVTITVDGASGPFAVTAPNGGGTLSGAQNVTWSVNNTINAPISTANVKITLSTDGGNSFPITLAASTANTGTAGVTLPNGVTSTTARVKVEAIGNIFFDISDANFTIVPADTCPAVSDISPKVGNIGDTVTITGVNFMNGGNVTGVKFNNNVTATFTVVNDTTITTTVPAGAVGGPITVSKTGCPDVQTAGYNICPNPPVSISISDEAAESASNFGDGAYYVNRLTPGGYPATLTRIHIFWGTFQNFPTGTPINIVAGINAGGGANIDGTAFQTFADTSGPLDQYKTFTLPNPMKITAGDFVVGFQVPTNPGGSFPIAVDTDTSSNRSYTSGNGTTFTAFAGPGNFMIRAREVYIGSCTGPTAINGSIGGTITDASGTPVSGVAINLNGTESREAVTDSSGKYGFDNVETNGFYTVTPSRANYSFSPANRSFSLLGVRTEASFTANANGDRANAIDTNEFFVRQHYLDFLNREPDPPGFIGWVNTLRNCAAGDASCDRVHVSESFYRAQEFQERGYFAYRFYATALGRKPDYAEFTPDLARVSGFLTSDQLEAAKTAFIDDFMMRPAFAAQYNRLSDSAYVDALLNTAGVNLSNRQAMIDSLNRGTATRAQVLRQIAESGEVYQRYYNQAFVVMEYFGYLRRDPDALYLDWIRALDANPADSRRMVDGFVNSTEYRNRFAP
jgi:hypothetical protein